jgi:hypothetical protein
MDKCIDCITPPGTRCESIPSDCPYRISNGFTHVAIKINDLIYTLPKPYRHHHIIKKLSELGINTYEHKDTQGFIFNGEFVNRSDGAVLAEQTGYILKTPPSLFSEDLW